MRTEPLSRRVRHAFTLIELLVVIAIIAVLIAMLVPAVQKVRDAAFRAQCLNNMKQWALAMHSFHDVNRQFPFGSNGNPRQTWVMYLWPYMEQNALAEQNDYTQSFFLPPATIANTMNGLCGQAVAQYNCPSDTGVDQTGPCSYPRRRGNYVVNWGAAPYYSTLANPAILAPFGLVIGYSTDPYQTNILQITDGTSNTLLLSEYLKAFSPLDDDWRGDIHNDQGVFRFHTILTPNSPSPDVLSSGFEVSNTDPLMPVVAGSPDYNATRSRHTGGVNAAMCDGSTRFVANGISLTTWQALGTMNGDEIIGSDW